MPAPRFGRLVLALALLVSEAAGVAPGRAAAQSGCDVSLSPGDDLQAVVDAQPPGATFCFEPGLYREASIEARDGDAFVGVGQVILSGARLLTDFERVGGRWLVDDQEQEGFVHGDCERAAPRCDYPEDLFFDGEPLLHVARRSDVGPGTWYFDYRADRIYLGDDPAGHVIETSISPFAISGNAGGVTVRDLTVERYANPAQVGAIQAGFGFDGEIIPLAGWLIEGVTARRNHGAGIGFEATNGTVVRDSRALANGQIGIVGTGSDSLIEGNEIAFNNTLGFEITWEAGGTKFALHDGLTIRDNHAHDNNGPGLWTDIDNDDVLYEGNLVEDNTTAGIFHEISFNAVIRDNVVERNGAANALWCYGAGIQISASSDVVVERNILRDNARSIVGIAQERGDDYHVRNLLVRNNLVENRAVRESITGVCQDAELDVYSPEANNRYLGNVYLGPGQAWTWDDRDLETDFAAWQAYGLDRGGSYAPKPKLSRSPTSGVYNATVELSLVGFAPGEEIALRWYDGDAPRLLATLTADRLGKAKTSFRVPATVGGSHRIRAAGDGGHAAATRFTVLPRLRPSPGEGAVGASLRLCAFGFAAGESITFRWREGTAWRTLKEATASARGSVCINGKVPRGAAPGPHDLEAAGNQGARAVASFAVVE